LPDPLASLFVPLELDAESFDGWLSVRNGLSLAAVVGAGSAPAAEEIADSLQASIPSLPAVAKDLEITVSGDKVTLALDLNRDQLAASLRHPDQAPAATLATPVVPPVVAAAPPPMPKPAAVAEKPKTPEPQVIRILGLDDGPREILLPPEPRF
jgi:hypothetical protein